jgi:hypothetical protein
MFIVAYEKFEECLFGYIRVTISPVFAGRGIAKNPRENTRIAFFVVFLVF